MSDDSINLSTFCGDEPLRPHLHKPFSRGEWTYATDGRIIVRVQRRPDVPEGDDTLEKVTQLFANCQAPGLRELRHVDLPPPESRKIECTFCKGTGKEHECPDCDCECEMCDDIGRVDRPESVTVEISGVVFAARYVRLLQTLPNVRVSTTAVPGAPFRFSFDGGEGIVMPFNGRCGTHIVETPHA